MFFSQRIASIGPADKVLEIGPGSTPHPRSDVYLELKYETKEEEQAQFGHTGELNTIKPIVFYDGKSFPFKDGEFDYVICSHVLEHVPDVEFFLKELQRVAAKGYLEFPTVYYDYLFNFSVHQNFLFWTGNEILWSKKNVFPLNSFLPVQSIFREALELQTISVVNQMKEVFIQGFEWSEKIVFQQSNSIDRFCFKNFMLEDKRYKKSDVVKVGFRQKLKIKLKLIIDSCL
ncbi:MAG: methyltransferase domain-containing protein [Cyclobacteriaceae bacterium]|nr:methyltransferase domain-containing protein [Cyclobacteriaceae bacterium]